MYDRMVTGMGLYLNPGNEALKISVNDDIFIDQSGILIFTNNRIGKRKRYLCVSRPRRFGKSLTAEMLTAYYDRSCNSEALRVYIDMNFDGLRDAITAMLGGISCEIDTGTFRNDMTSFSGRDDVLTLLVHLGYLAYDEDSHAVCIPNDEVRSEFLRAVKSSGWKEVVDAVKASEALLEATLNMDADAVAKGIDIVQKGIIL